MARVPLLADPQWPNKARAGRAHAINTCIACNQACLDHIFEREIASCLVNPFACRETELAMTRATIGRSQSWIWAPRSSMSVTTAALGG